MEEARVVWTYLIQASAHNSVLVVGVPAGGTFS